ncbi:MAG TPA: phosphatidylglycerophosphatase A [Terriglobia bacterium]|nr:phosphatidylglycerophosphatase A [Terriglobia bacterium]
MSKSKKTTWAWLVGTFFGIGKLKPGPGTWASVVTVLLWWAAIRGTFVPHQWLVAAILAVFVTLVGIPASTIVARESGTKDPSFVVIDEVAGQLIALIFVPPEWKYLLASLILFRGFDIVKPPPLRRLERLPEGTGIMLDDVGAGFYAWVIMMGLVHYKILG